MVCILTEVLAAKYVSEFGVTVVVVVIEATSVTSGGGEPAISGTAVAVRGGTCAHGACS